MYWAYLLVICVFLGVDGGKLAKPINRDTNLGHSTVIDYKNGTLININSNIPLNSTQLIELQETIDSIFSNLFSIVNLNGYVNPRNPASSKLKFFGKIGFFGNTIIKSIKSFLYKWGLWGSRPDVQADNYNDIQDRNKIEAVYRNLLQMPLKLSPVLRQSKTRISKVFQKNSYTHLGYKSARTSFPLEYVYSTEEWRLPAILGFVEMYSRNMLNCLKQKPANAFNLKNAVIKLSKFSPEKTSKILKNRLEKPALRHPRLKKGSYNEFHAFLCHAVVDNLRSEYSNCLKEVKRVGDCTYTKLKTSPKLDLPLRKSSKKFLKIVKKLDDSCESSKDGISLSAVCSPKLKAKRSDDFSFIADYVTNDVTSSPSLERMTNQLGSEIMKTQLGAEAVHEMGTLLRIYKQGTELKAAYMMAAKEAPYLRYKYLEVAEDFKSYEQFLARSTFTTINRIHGVVDVVNKALVEVAEPVRNLTWQVEAWGYWTDYINTNLDDLSHAAQDFPTQPPPGTSNYDSYEFRNESSEFYTHSDESANSGLIVVPNDIAITKNTPDESLNKLNKLLKSLNNEPRLKRNSGNSLITLANTFLLTTMFYECIAFVAAAVFSNNKNSVFEINDTDNPRSMEAEHYQWSARPPRASPIEKSQEDLDVLASKDNEEPISTEKDDMTGPSVTPNDAGIDESVENVTIDGPEIAEDSSN